MFILTLKLLFNNASFIFAGIYALKMQIKVNFYYYILQFGQKNWLYLNFTVSKWMGQVNWTSHFESKLRDNCVWVIQCILYASFLSKTHYLYKN